MLAPWLLVAAVTLGANAQRGAFTPVKPLSVARSGHTATLLDDGRVLIVGGRGLDGTRELDDVEWFDSKSKTFKKGPSLKTGRSGHTATLLTDGKVLVAGGTTHEDAEQGARFVALASTELFDPKSNQWSPGPSMGEARNFHTATRLPDGKVLVTGGAREQKLLLETCELFDPAHKTFTPAPKLSQPRCLHQAVAATDGSVWISGGRSPQSAPPVAVDGGQPQRPHGEAKAGFGGPVATVERFTAGAWEKLPENTDARQRHAFVALANGSVATVGGATPHGLTNLMERWSKDKKVWETPEHSLSAGLASHTATVLPKGELLVIGGEPVNQVDTERAQVFQPAKEVWCLAGELRVSRKLHTATLLKDGKVLVVGGVSSGVPEASAEMWEPRDGKCEEPPGPTLDW